MTLPIEDWYGTLCHSPCHCCAGEWLADADRPLTPKACRRAVLGLQCLKVRFDRLYHSPWLRAVETAELLAPVLDGKAVDSAALARAPSQDLLDALVVNGWPWWAMNHGWGS